MALNSFGYPTGATSTSTTAPASTTQQAVYQSLEAFNNASIELYDTSSYSNGAPMMSMLTNFGRSRNGGSFDDIGVNEVMVDTGMITKWREQDGETDIFIVNAASAAGTAGANTSFTVTSTAGLVAQTIVRNVRTGEQLRVVSIDSATTFTATRKVGTINNVAMVVGDVLQRLATAVGRGVADLDAYGAPAVEREGYIQKFVQTLKIDDFDMMSSKIMDPKAFIAKMSGQKAYALREDQERAALFGQAYKDPSGNHYTTEGLLSFAGKGFAGDISGSLTTRTMEETLTTCTEYMSPNNNMKLLVLGTKARAAINSLYTGRIRRETIADIKEQVETIEIGNAKFAIVPHPLMNEKSGFNRHAMVVDPGYIKICYPTGVDLEGKGFNGRARFEMNPASTYANMTGSFVSYMGLQNISPNSAGLFQIAA